MENGFINEIKRMFEDKLEKSILREKLLEFHPYELSEAILELTEEQRLRLYRTLQPEDICYAIAHLEIDEILELFDEMKPRYIVNIIQELDMDDAVDVMQALPEEERAGYLRLMDKENKEKIQDLFKYKEDTAGSIMTTEYIEISVKDSVEKAMIIRDQQWFNEQSVRADVGAVLTSVQRHGVTGEIAFDREGRRRAAPIWVYQISEEKYPGNLVAP